VPLQFLLHENARGLLWWAGQRHNVQGDNPIDAVRVGDPADLPLASDDTSILLWAEKAGRILVSFDKNTLPTHLAHHLQAGRHSPAIFLIRRTSRVRPILSFLVLAAYASEPPEWQDRIEYIG
jgi:hypothetical protein